ncbi:hypothetical protein DFH28DRAFT_903219 [Melampsora americana]|nr:hypothetical protein DFH28DRAFT_903219 [Melampsora americana]
MGKRTDIAALNADTNSFNIDLAIEKEESDCAHGAGHDEEETAQPTNYNKPFCSNARTLNNLLFVAICGITMVAVECQMSQNNQISKFHLKNPFEAWSYQIHQ